MDRDLTLVTACFYKDESPAQPLLESCRKNSIPISVFGVREDFEGYCVSKLVRLREHLLSLSNRDVLYVDGSDVIAVVPFEELKSRYGCVQRSNGWKVTLAADYALHPDSIHKSVFDKLAPTGSLFKYPCAGVIGGNRHKVIEALDGVIEVWKRTRDSLEDKQKDNDQGYWIEAIGSGVVNVALDYKAMVSVSLHHYKKDWFAAKSPVVTLSNGVTPALLHFNGSVPKRRLMKAYLRKGSF